MIAWRVFAWGVIWVALLGVAMRSWHWRMAKALRAHDARKREMPTYHLEDFGDGIPRKVSDRGVRL